jgi:hypothetical protein
MGELSISRSPRRRQDIGLKKLTLPTMAIRLFSPWVITTDTRHLAIRMVRMVVRPTQHPNLTRLNTVGLLIHIHHMVRLMVRLSGARLIRRILMDVVVPSNPRWQVVMFRRTSGRVQVPVPVQVQVQVQVQPHILLRLDIIHTPNQRHMVHLLQVMAAIRTILETILVEVSGVIQAIEADLLAISKVAIEIGTVTIINTISIESPSSNQANKITVTSSSVLPLQGLITRPGKRKRERQIRIIIPLG